MRSNHSSSSAARALASRVRQVEQLADQHQVLGAGQVLVDRGVLAGQADGLAHLRAASRATSKPPTRARAGVGPQQRGQDADGGGLAGAVGAEHAEHGALARGEVDAVERLGGAEALAQAGRFDHVHVASVVGPLARRAHAAVTASAADGGLRATRG